MLNYSQFRQPALSVGYVTPSLGAGGAERWLIDLATNAQKTRTACIVFTGPEHEPNPLLSEIPRGIPYYASTDPKRILQRLRSNGANVILTWGDTSWLEHQIAELTLPVIQASHACVGKISQVFAHFLAGCSVESLSVFPREATAQTNPQVIHNGVCRNRLIPTEQRSVIREDHWGINNRSKILGWIGRFSEEKDPLRFLKILQQLPDDYCGIMMGWGPMSRQLMDSREASELKGRVRFLQPSLRHIGNFYHGLDALVMTSRTEALPLVFLEALNCNRPVICPRLPFIDEFEKLWNGEYSDAYAPDVNPLGIANTIVDSLTRRSEPDFEDSWYKVAQSSYSLPQMVHRWESYIHDCFNLFLDAGTNGSIHVPV